MNCSEQQRHVPLSVAPGDTFRSSWRLVALLQQAPHILSMTIKSCIGKSCSAIRIQHSNVSPVLEQASQRLSVATECHMHQGGPTALISSLNVGTICQKTANHIDMTTVSTGTTMAATRAWTLCNPLPRWDTNTAGTASCGRRYHMSCTAYERT